MRKNIMPLSYKVFFMTKLFMLSTSKAKKLNTFQNNFKYLKEYSKKFRKKLIGKREEEFYGFP